MLLTVHSFNNSLLRAYLKQRGHQVECDLVPVHKELKLPNSIQFSLESYSLSLLNVLNAFLIHRGY